MSRGSPVGRPVGAQRGNQGRHAPREVDIPSLLRDYYFNSGYFDRTIGEGKVRAEYETWLEGDMDLYEAGRISAVVFGSWALRAPDKCDVVWTLAALPNSIRHGAMKITWEGGQKWDPVEKALIETYGTTDFNLWSKSRAFSSGHSWPAYSSSQAQRLQAMQSQGYSFEEISNAIDGDIDND